MILNLFITVPAHAAEAALLPLQMTIRMYGGLLVDSKTLEGAEGVAASIFASAGLGAEWETAPLSAAQRLGMDFSAGRGDPCFAPLPSSSLAVQLIARAPAGFNPQALGFALPCSQFGIQVTIYLDRVEAVAASTNARYYRVLGHALAHELGHVLLRSSGHAEGGVMKGDWCKVDWQRAAVTLLPFSPQEGTLIANELRKAILR